MKGTKPQLVVDNDAITGVPSPPGWLSKDAKAEWRRVMPPLIQRRILTRADLGSLENYCIAQGRIRELEVKIQGEDEADALAKLSRLQDKAMATARQLAAELGATPVSRSRPTVRKEGEADDLNPLNLS